MDPLLQDSNKWSRWVARLVLTRSIDCWTRLRALEGREDRLPLIVQRMCSSRFWWKLQLGKRPRPQVGYMLLQSEELNEATRERRQAYERRKVRGLPEDFVAYSRAVKVQKLLPCGSRPRNIVSTLTMLVAGARPRLPRCSLPRLAEAREERV